MPLNITILGAGVTGLTTALALRRNLPSKPNLKVLEIRDGPSTIGGAVNLTPKALRYLDSLGVLALLRAKRAGADCHVIELYDLYSGKKYSEVDFRGADGKGIGKEEGKKYFARRVMRRQLQAALLEACEANEGIQVVFGKKVTGIMEDEGRGVYLTFEDGDSSSSDLLLGCDGIHSAARNLLVDPERHPTYTGISTVMATAQLRPDFSLRWETTGLVSSRRGSLMCSYYEPEKTQQYIAVVMEVAEVADREGWRVRGSDQAAIKKDIMERFKSDNMPELENLVGSAGEWTLYPVYALPPNGKWTSPKQRCILLGDSAHAMAPQGESTGICIEDAIVFSRAMMQYDTNGLHSAFNAFETFRRDKIEEAVSSASQRWETLRDSGWLAYQLKCLITPVYLWWTAKAREEEFADDHTDLDFKAQF